MNNTQSYLFFQSSTSCSCSSKWFFLSSSSEYRCFSASTSEVRAFTCTYVASNRSNHREAESLDLYVCVCVSRASKRQNQREKETRSLHLWCVTCKQSLKSLRQQRHTSKRGMFFSPLVILFITNVSPYTTFRNNPGRTSRRSHNSVSKKIREPVVPHIVICGRDEFVEKQTKLSLLSTTTLEVWVVSQTCTRDEFVVS